MRRLDQLLELTIILTFSALPLWFIPLFQDHYDTPKWFLLLGSALFIFLIWIVRSVISRTFTVTWSAAGTAWAALTVVSLVNLFTKSVNRLEALTNPFGPLTYLSLLIIFLLGLPRLTARGRNWLQTGWLAAIFLLSLTAIYQYFLSGKFLLQLAPYLIDQGWSPAGSSVALLTIFWLTAPGLLKQILEAVRHKQENRLIFFILIAILLFLGGSVTLIILIPKLRDSWLPLTYGWAVMLHAWKNVSQAILGVGLDNFFWAFTTGRPLALNSTHLWNLRFITNTSLALHLGTVMGLTGLVGLGFLVKSLVSAHSYFAVIALLVFPPSFSGLLATAYILLVLPGHPDPAIFHLKSVPDRFWQYFTGVMVSITGAASVIVSGYFLGLLIRTEYIFYQSVVAARVDDGTRTYNLQKQTLSLIPGLTRYHLAYSQTNLAIAGAIAANIRREAEESTAVTPRRATGEEQQTVASLIQQAIDSGKQATVLSPGNVLTWESLGRTYIKLIGIAAGSDRWAVASFEQAVKLDPNNPLLRIDLGGAQMRMQNTTEAIKQFEAAIALKPDLANAYFNLGTAQAAAGNRDAAITNLRKTMNLLPTGSSDYQKAQGQLDSLLTPTP